jgi:hypothetical protein
MQRVGKLHMRSLQEMADWCKERPQQMAQRVIAAGGLTTGAQGYPLVDVTLELVKLFAVLQSLTDDMSCMERFLTQTLFDAPLHVVDGEELVPTRYLYVMGLLISKHRDSDDKKVGAQHRECCRRFHNLSG